MGSRNRLHIRYLRELVDNQYQLFYTGDFYIQFAINHLLISIGTGINTQQIYFFIRQH